MHNVLDMRSFGLHHSRVIAAKGIVSPTRVSISGFLLILNLFLASAVAAEPIVQNADTPHGNDSVSIFMEQILFPKVSAVVSRNFSENNARIDSIFSFLSETATQDLLSVKITGSHSPEGKDEFNTNLADARARALSALVKEINPDINPVTAITHPSKDTDVDYRQLRNAELKIVYRNNTAAGNRHIDRTEEQKTHDRPGEDISTNSESLPEGKRNYPPLNTLGTSAASDKTNCHGTADQPHSPSIPRSGNFMGDKLFFTTNMLYDAALTPNIGVGINVAERVTVLADWMYARWNNRDKRRYWRIYGGDLEVRYRIGPHRKGSPLGGHYVGAYGSIACYDFQAGRSHTGVLSDKYNYAVGVSYTYTLPLSARLNIDFNLGIGYLWGTYKKHRPIDDCDVWLSTHKLGWIGPTRIGVTLVWLVGNDVKNDRKGGGR